MVSNILYFIKRYGVAGYIKYKLLKDNSNEYGEYLHVQHRYYEKLSAEQYEHELGCWYKTFYNRDIANIRNPETFNDKIQWLKINDNSELRSICADKIAVREYIKSKNISNLNVVPMIAKWDNADAIDFDQLPESFVLKQNAACKLNYIVTDKSKEDYQKLKKLLKTWLEITFGYNGMELQYINSKKYIFAEQYLHELGEDLYDYKVFCFNGIPKFIEVIGDRGTDLKQGHVSFFDLDWKPLGFRTLTYAPFTKLPPKPDNLEKMIEIASILSKPFTFVRVDLYDVSGEVYFGEMTFTPANGAARWDPPEANYELGGLISLTK